MQDKANALMNRKRNIAVLSTSFSQAPNDTGQNCEL